MSTNTIDSGDNGKIVADAAAPKRTRTPAKKAKASKNAPWAKKADQPKPDRANKKAEVLAMMKREGCDPGRDHGRHQVAGTHGPGLRQYPGQQGRAEDRILEEHTYRIA